MRKFGANFPKRIQSAPTRSLADAHSGAHSGAYSGAHSAAADQFSSGVWAIAHLHLR